jgi:IS30 family transposase
MAGDLETRADFAHPYASSEPGRNEDSNGLI